MLGSTRSYKSWQKETLKTSKWHCYLQYSLSVLCDEPYPASYYDDCKVLAARMLADLASVETP